MERANGMREKEIERYSRESDRESVGGRIYRQRNLNYYGSKKSIRQPV